MKAAVLYEINTPLKIEEFDLPDTGPNQVRVRIVASGVCHSDWHVVKGDWPHIPIPTILGHEGAGIVEEVGESSHWGSRGRPRYLVVEAELWLLRDVSERVSHPVRTPA